MLGNGCRVHDLRHNRLVRDDDGSAPMTPEVQALVELAERCETATGADRKIDGAIGVGR